MLSESELLRLNQQRRLPAHRADIWICLSKQGSNQKVREDGRLFAVKCCLKALELLDFGFLKRKNVAPAERSEKEAGFNLF